MLADHVQDQFELDRESPYMLIVAPVREELCIPMTQEQDQLFGIDKLNVPRSSLPAVTHVDYSARVQTVHAETNPRFHGLLSAFHAHTGCPTLVNTSFNVRGEPIVCNPEDAYRFMRTEMDVLVLENQILLKHENPNPQNHTKLGCRIRIGLVMKRLPTIQRQQAAAAISDSRLGCFYPWCSASSGPGCTTLPRPPGRSSSAALALPWA